MSIAPAVDPELLEILRCPESLQAVRLAEDSVLRHLQDQARQATLQNLQGTKVTPGFEALLIREDGKRAYLVREGIPVMLIDEAVAL